MAATPRPVNAPHADGAAAVAQKLDTRVHRSPYFHAVQASCRPSTKQLRRDGPMDQWPKRPSVFRTGQLPEPWGRQPCCVSVGPQVSGACAFLEFRWSLWFIWFVRFVRFVSSCLIVRADRFVGSMSRFPGRGQFFENYRTGTAEPAIGPCQEHSQRGNLTQAEDGNSIQAGNGNSI